MHARRRRWLLPLLGLSSACLAALGLSLLIIYVIQPAMSRETWGRTIVRGEIVNLWIPEDSALLDTAHTLLEDLETELRQVISRVNADPEEIPLPVDVFLHENTGQLMQSLMNRKSTNTMNLASPLDLMAGTNPSTALSELVLAHAWGECRSQVFYLGTVLLVAHPDRDFHAMIAALPEGWRDSADALAAFESAGALQCTYYQGHNSPFSDRFVVTLDAFAEVLKLRSGDPLAPSETLLALESASLIQYLAEQQGGIPELREAWRKGFARPCLETAFGRSMEDLTVAWHSEAARHTDAKEYPQYEVRCLIDAGRAEEAFRMASTWLPDPGVSESDLLIRSALLAGRLRELAEWEDVLVTSCSDRAKNWLSACQSMQCVVEGDIRVLGPLPETDLARLAREASQARVWVIEALDLDAATASPFTVFIHPDEEANFVLEDLIDAGIHQVPAVVLRGAEDARRAVIRTVPSIAVVPTRSLLLQRGLAVALSTPIPELIEKGRGLRTDGSWIAFSSLDYMGRDEEVVDAEAGLLIAHLLETDGAEALKECWQRTSQRGGQSLSRALNETVGRNLKTLESEVVASYGLNELPQASSASSRANSQ